MTKAKAHANIALIKYWGKKDEVAATPYTSSLSLTLDALYTITEVKIDPSLERDQFFLNGVEASEAERLKTSRFVDFFRQGDQYVRIDSQNFFPTAAGLASSASGYAALATALNQAFGTALDKRALSRITRKGSGSASRSLYGGFAIWEKGDDQSSVAYPFEATLDLEMIIVVVNAAKKSRSSRELMRATVESSIFYPAWVEQSALDLEEMKAALLAQDIHRVGAIAERNALSMHGTLLGLAEPFSYFEADTMRVFDLVYRCREAGLAAYITMDAGPNVKIITNSVDREQILRELKAIIPSEQVIVAQAGPEAEILS